jgi:colanic acid/amylovoran biosynthesis glycosyltransferase
MKLGYLLNSYPMTSTTFIRREIEAIEALGTPVVRFAVRHWETALVEPADIAEQARTAYILTGSKSALLRDSLAGLLRHPLRALGALPLWYRLFRNAGGPLVTHAAYFIEALALERRAARLGLTHLHVHFSTNAAAVAMLAHAFGGPRYSFTVHGPDELIDPAALSLVEKTRRAAFVAAITQYCRGRILSEAPDCAEKVVIVPCGIDVAQFNFDPVQPDNGRIVCVGRLCHNKGQKHIPAAVAQVKDEFPELIVELIGGGDDEALIRAEIAKFGVEKHVLLSGWGTADQVRAAIRHARALLLPSYAEGLPIVIMEALAIGRPVLTTCITGIPELVDAGCGWLFEPGDVNAIADALRSALRSSPEQRAAMGIEGRRRIEERHDLNLSAKRLLDHLKAAQTQ